VLTKQIRILTSKEDFTVTSDNISYAAKAYADDDTAIPPGMSHIQSAVCTAVYTGHLSYLRAGSVNFPLH
jgi:hypothetical protein